MSGLNSKLNWKIDQLWNGCMLASIAHAIMVAHYPELSNEHSWDGINYNVQDSAGIRGTITFHPEFCVAAFCNDNSDRITTDTFTNVSEYFKGAPQEIVKLAEEEALQYLLHNVNGKTIPVITTAFWGSKNELFTGDSFDLMMQNGAVLLERQLMDSDLSIKAWKEYYDMSERQVDLLKLIFMQKIANPKDIISISKKEVEMIGANEEEGLNESRESFEEIGIECEV